MNREIMQQALTALRISTPFAHALEYYEFRNKAIKDIEFELAKPEQEPVAYLYHDASCAELANSLAHSTLLVLACDRKPSYRNETPLYTAPQQLAKPEQQFYPDWDMIKPFHERIAELEEQLAKREWVGLTEDEIWECQKPGLSDDVYKLIEAKLRIKNEPSC